MHLLGIDVGGTKTSVCVGDETGRILGSKRILSRPETGPADWMKRVTVCVCELLRELNLPLDRMEAIGLATPGPMSVARGLMMEPPMFKGWVDVPVVNMVTEALQRPVYINNDANACALAEWLFGACKGADNLVYLTMSTGMGGGVVANGKILQGAADLAGEIGHFVLDIAGPPCACGQRGCFEAFCGGAAVAGLLRDRIAREQIDTAILKNAANDPARIDFRVFLEAVRQKDHFALEFWDSWLERLAQGIGTIIMAFNPQAVILGTIAIHAGDLLLDPLRKRLPRYAWAPSLAACTIMASTLDTRIGDLAALAVAAGGMKGKK
ncbi:MAG: ROK family protein [Lentisphaerae bacterium]|nr:ROK family protein [Lentisphaerota bacterium]